MFSVIISGEADIWETDQVMRMEMSRFKEYSGGKEADAVSPEQPETLGLLEKTPALLLYENGTQCKNADAVRYGVVRDIQCNGHYVLFRFEEQSRIPKSNLKDFSSRLGLATYELNRTHWALKEGGIPSGFLEKAEAVARPVVFISYSHTSEVHKRRVEGWAKRLEENRISARIDLLVKLGQDLNSFMESMVSDPAISKVLVFSDKRYAQKADGRSGGVGTEAQILSPEVYAKIDQTKIIPIVCEFEKGKACLPIFLKSRKWLDFSTDDQADANFGELLDDIFERARTLRSNEAAVSVQPKHELVFDMNASPIIADELITNIADDLTYEAQQGVIPPAKAVVRGLKELRDRVASLNAKPSLTADEKRERVSLTKDMQEAEEDERCLQKGLSIIFSRPSLKWTMIEGPSHHVALCLKDFFRYFRVRIEHGTKFDVWGDDFPDLSFGVWLSEEEVESLKKKTGFHDLNAFLFGGHFVCDFEYRTIFGKVYPAIVWGLCRQKGDLSEAELEDLLNPMKWRVGLG